MPDRSTLDTGPPRRVVPVVAPSTTPVSASLTSALDFGTAATTVARSARSVRRTSHLDSLRRGHGTEAPVTISGAARDLRTGDDGVTTTVLGAAKLEADLDGTSTLRRLVTSPGAPTTGLIGRTVGHGFRAALDGAVPDERQASTPLYLLLDDLPVVLVITGYTRLFSEEQQGGADRLRDVCAGFRADSVMMQSVDARGSVPLSIGPTARRLERDDDPSAWHEMGALAPGAMRRRRLVEVRGGDGWSFYGYFRDTYRASLAEPEIVVHEYQIHGELDADGRTVLSCQADPLTLPWPECPHAAASAAWIVGRTTGEIRDVVRRQFRGTDTCTHLNDLIRSLGDLPALAAALD